MQRCVLFLACFLFNALPLIAQVSLPDSTQQAGDSTTQWYEMPAVIVVGSADRRHTIAGSATILGDDILTGTRPFNVNELLQHVPGVHTRDEEGFALRPNIGIRGLNPTRSTKVLLLEDGLPLAYAPYGDNASYYHPPVDRFARSEVLKGSEQILFGPQTIGGVVNYITPTPPLETHGLVSFSAGSRNTYDGHVRFGHSGLMLDLVRKQGDGARDNEEPGFTDVNFKGLLIADQKSAVALRANYYHEQSAITYTGITEQELKNFGVRYNPYDNDEFTASRYGLSATHESELSETVLLTTSLYGSYFSRDWWRQSSSTTDAQGGSGVRDTRLAGLRIDPDTIASTQGRLRKYTTYGLEPRLLIRYAAFGVNNELSTGLRAHFEIQKREQQNATTATARTGAVVENNDRHTQGYSGFVQNRFLFGVWSITPGLRLEHVINERTDNRTGASGSTSLTEWIPGLGATVAPFEHTTLFISAHRGFAPPRTEDLILTPAGQPEATFTDVDPEHSWNFELGARANPESWLNLEATFFRNYFQNLIAVGSIAGGSTPLAQARALFQGAEFSGGIDSRSGEHTGFFFTLVYTFLPTAEQKSPFVQVANDQPVAGSREGNRMPYAPEHMLTAGIGVGAHHHWDVRLEAVSVSTQFSNFANTTDPSADGQSGTLPSYTIFNATANYEIPSLSSTVFLTIKNIADHEYIADRTRGIRPGAPRRIQAGFQWDF